MQTTIDDESNIEKKLKSLLRSTVKLCLQQGDVPA